MTDLPCYPPAGWEELFRSQLWDERPGGGAPAPAATLTEFVKNAYATKEIYPPREQLFAAFEAVPLSQVRVVILGQDPYHEPGQAHGLAFSVPEGTKLPPSLRNIFKEIAADTGLAPYPSGDLHRWAAQGVLLLNTVLTVERGAAASHRGQGWERFTDAAIAALDASPQPMVFLLWGKDARSKRRLLQNPAHLVLEADHPSPLSAWRGFFGCGHFSATNEFLLARGAGEIDWR